MFGKLFNRKKGVKLGEAFYQGLEKFIKENYTADTAPKLTEMSDTESVPASSDIFGTGIVPGFSKESGTGAVSGSQPSNNEFGMPQASAMAGESAMNCAQAMSACMPLEKEPFRKKAFEEAFCEEALSVSECFALEDVSKDKLEDNEAEDEETENEEAVAKESEFEEVYKSEEKKRVSDTYGELKDWREKREKTDKGTEENKSGKTVFQPSFLKKTARRVQSDSAAPAYDQVPEFEKKAAEKASREGQKAQPKNAATPQFNTAKPQFKTAVPQFKAAKPRSLEDTISQVSESWQESLFRIIDEKGADDVEVYKTAGVDRKLFSKIRSNRAYQPKKNTALLFALALKLTLDETKDMLARAGFALSKSSKSDLIVEYFIENGVHDIYTINLALYEHDEACL